jgi:two-component system cell cycle sensor histidine kinase/response regulator CckA
MAEPHHPTVMVVEDEPDVLGVTARMLEEAGYQVTGARTALEALAHLDDSVGLLVLDVRLPDLSGPELARRAWRRRPEVRVLFVSAFPEGPPQDAPLLQECLIKPFTADQLVAAVERLLAR